MVGKYISYTLIIPTGIHILIILFCYNYFLLFAIIKYIDDVSQTENNYLADINDTMFNTSEFEQRPYFVVTQNQIAGKILFYYSCIKLCGFIN